MKGRHAGRTDFSHLSAACSVSEASFCAAGVETLLLDVTDKPAHGLRIAPGVLGLQPGVADIAVRKHVERVSEVPAATHPGDKRHAFGAAAAALRRAGNRAPGNDAQECDSEEP